MNNEILFLGITIGALTVITLLSFFMVIESLKRMALIDKRLKMVEKKVRKHNVEQDLTTSMIGDVFQAQQEQHKRVRAIESAFKVNDERYAIVDRFLEIMRKDTEEMESEFVDGLKEKDAVNESNS